jgi:hypothetical protein
MTMPPMTSGPSNQFLNARAEIALETETPESWLELSSSSPSSSATESAFQLSTTTPGEEGLGSAYLFVDNNDKQAAVRLRSALATRKHRKLKLSKVAELEEKLRVMENEKNAWKRKAEFWRKALGENHIMSTPSIRS